jgi:hypothetical protein
MPSLPQPNGRCCVIKNAAGQQIAIHEVPGLSPAAITAARKGADEILNNEGYTGPRNYTETAVRL